jgi:hypothetical protein
MKIAVIDEDCIVVQKRKNFFPGEVYPLVFLRRNVSVRT